MHFYPKQSLIVLCSSMMILTGCQSLPISQKMPPLVEQNIENTTTPSTNQFNLQGKIGVKTPQQSGSAFFTWVQQQDQFDIELSGILGIGKTQITGELGKVELNSSRTGLISAETPEELLEIATGWQAPITYIIDWVQARPATSQAEISTDSSMRPTQFIEEGWVVDLSYKDQTNLPNRLVLKQALESGKENRITMVIQNR